MRTRLLNAPWWVLALLTGVPFAAWMAVFELLDDGGGVASAMGGAAAGGVFFGVFMGVFLARANKRARAVVSDPPADRAAMAHRAAMGGPVPDDRQIRAAAARLVAHDLDVNRRAVKWSIALFGALLLLTAWLATSSSPWWWLVASMWCAGIAFALWVPSRLERRLERLKSDGHGCATA